MSEKLPVGETLNEAFQFGLKRWGTVIRYGWATFAVAIAAFTVYAVAVIGPGVFKAAAGGEEINSMKDIFQMPIPTVIGLGVVVYAVVALLFCGVIASLYRLVALGEDRPGIFHLRVDGPAVRVFLSFFIIAVLNALIWAAALGISFAINGQDFGSFWRQCVRFIELAAASETGEVSNTEVLSAFSAIFQSFMLGGLIALVPLLYLNIKLIPFPPGTAAENRLLLFGSFGLTMGHFWSILGAYVLFIIFVMILTIIFQIALAVLQAIGGLATDMGGALAIVGAVLGVVVFLASLFFNIFLFGVQVALRAVIYRRLATGA